MGFKASWNCYQADSQSSLPVIVNVYSDSDQKYEVTTRIPEMICSNIPLYISKEKENFELHVMPHSDFNIFLTQTFFNNIYFKL